MSNEVRWYQSLAWKFFLRTSLTILLIIGVLEFATSSVANRKARESAVSQMVSASQLVNEAFEQQGLQPSVAGFGLRGLRQAAQVSAEIAIRLAIEERFQVVGDKDGDRGHGYAAVQPPSITRLCPVMNEDASDARKTTPPAMSRGVPNRPIGVPDSMRWP